MDRRDVAFYGPADRDTVFGKRRAPQRLGLAVEGEQRARREPDEAATLRPHRDLAAFGLADRQELRLLAALVVPAQRDRLVLAFAVNGCDDGEAVHAHRAAAQVRGASEKLRLGGHGNLAGEGERLPERAIPGRPRPHAEDRHAVEPAVADP